MQRQQDMAYDIDGGATAPADLDLETLGRSSGRLPAVADAADAAPSAIGSLTLIDAAGVAYSFAAYPIRAGFEVTDAVYALSRLEGISPVPVLIDHADERPHALADDPRIAEAMALGAIYLLVHTPDPDDLIGPAEAARRLAAFHRPILSTAAD